MQINFKPIGLLIALACLSSFSSQAQFINGPTTVRCGGGGTYSYYPSNCPSNTINWIVNRPNGVSSIHTGNVVTINWGGAGGFGSIRIADCRSVSRLTVEVFNGRLRSPSLNNIQPLCNGVSTNITAGNVSGAASYTFRVPSGWRINGSSNPVLTTTSRTVRITAPPSGAGSANIQVRANPRGSCDLISRFTTKSVLYGSQPISIIGPAAAHPFIGTHYTARGVGLTNINWSITGGYLNGPRNTPSVTVDFGRGGGTIRVSAKSCGISRNTSKYVRSMRTNHRIEDLTSDDVKKEEVSPLTMYPIPANNVLYLEFPNWKEKEASRIKVYNQLQQVVLNQILDQPQVELDISQLTNGLYFIRYEGNGEALSRKFLVQH